MNNMNGNPHAQPAVNRRDQIIDVFIRGGDSTVKNTLALAHLEATLALAYEQRTANLIATLSVGAVDMSDWPQQVIDNFSRTSEEISARMGYGAGATE